MLLRILKTRTILLLIGMPGYEPPFLCLKTLIFKNSKSLLHTLKLTLTSSEIFYKSK